MAEVYGGGLIGMWNAFTHGVAQASNDLGNAPGSMVNNANRLTKIAVVGGVVVSGCLIFLVVYKFAFS
jgi:hypothetical protein